MDSRKKNVGHRNSIIISKCQVFVCISLSLASCFSKLVELYEIISNYRTDIYIFELETPKSFTYLPQSLNENLTLNNVAGWTF